MADVGDIFVATWGYDQTNADFFQVVAVKAKSVVVRHIKKEVVESPQAFMSGYALPLKGAFDGAQKLKRLKIIEGFGECFEAGDSMGFAEKWDGERVAISWYG